MPDGSFGREERDGCVEDGMESAEFHIVVVNGSRAVSGNRSDFLRGKTCLSESTADCGGKLGAVFKGGCDMSGIAGHGASGNFCENGKFVLFCKFCAGQHEEPGSVAEQKSHAVLVVWTRTRLCGHRLQGQESGGDEFVYIIDGVEDGKIRFSRAEQCGGAADFHVCGCTGGGEDAG